MSTPFILVRHAPQRNSDFDMLLEVYTPNGDYFSLKASLAWEVTRLAQLLGYPIKLWIYNPPAFDERIRQFAGPRGVRVLTGDQEV